MCSYTGEGSVPYMPARSVRERNVITAAEVGVIGLLKWGHKTRNASGL